MSTYYTLLGLEPDATYAAIEAAYQQQRQRYDPERVADLDPDMRRLAEVRSAELEQAYRTLSDAQRRQQYDQQLGIGKIAPPQATARRQLSARERNMVLIGGLVAVGLIIGIWIFTGRGAEVQGQPMGEVNRPAPNFTLQTLDGNEVSLADYQGKVVLVNFWGTWCEPCQRELPALQSANERYAEQGLVIIGVNLTDDERTQGRSEDDIRAFVEQYQLSYPIALDRDGRVTDSFRVFPLPTSFFIDPQGQIRYVHVGELTLNDIIARFTELQSSAMADATS
ncbi:alkyl hydroperoxide reductase/ Thiol specific antioxidant/ Mal allergen [Oscillochloris trichoides DG-6]|uniref:DnaJ homolog subfamily C member 10 n=1 Tax=Oscillochloris trichoides DG-6 TaxID=765420 RepID=E1ICC3_9CHLR|nr:redoxin domain-containing protein [Oscillochloris trichoides]EFO81177.1 alkyl hydroperoxide reductase/ Thiol specific antioxidant/ Mal allergen [Oscillochloris trichoides DG-6]